MTTMVTKELVMMLPPHYSTLLVFNDDRTTMHEPVKVTAHYCLHGHHHTRVYENMEELSGLLRFIEQAA